MTKIPELTIRIKKGQGGADTLTCVRPDGTLTWSRLHTFFPIHDLTHYAVESTLGLSNGFFGLVAQGWDISDFGTPWPRGPIPADAIGEAVWVEHAVSALWIEHYNQDESDFDQVNAILQASLSAHDGAMQRLFTAQELQHIRSRLEELYTQWSQLAPGDTLELHFP